MSHAETAANIPPTSHSNGPAQGEPTELKYLRQIRNATVFVAIVVALSIIGGVITGIAIAAHDNSASSTCVSQGGTLPGCLQAPGRSSHDGGRGLETAPGRIRAAAPSVRAAGRRSAPA